MEKQSGIYEIFNTINGKRYVGQALNMKVRRQQHIRELHQGRHFNPKLQRAWVKYGESAFKFLPVLTCQPSMLDFYEQQLLDKAKPEYNIAVAAGAPMRGRNHTPEFIAAAKLRRHTPEARAKISAAQTGKPNPSAYKMIEQNRGKKRSPETIAKMIANRVYAPWVMSAEGRAKISSARKGKPLSAEHRAKLSESHKGHVATESHCANLSAALKGKKKSPEHVAKVAAAIRAYHVRKRAAA
jgi:group I intron endonuclease